jgi:hypothetical protein
MPEFGQWRYSVDRAATDAAYACEPAGGAATCTCVGCRNFDAARGQIFPRRFVEFLESLGIDPAKEAEAYHTGRLASGRHHYGGWYHFIGILEISGDFAPVDFGDGFTSWMRAAVAPRLESLLTARVIELEFSTDRAPWVLNETELE